MGGADDWCFGCGACVPAHTNQPRPVVTGPCPRLSVQSNPSFPSSPKDSGDCAHRRGAGTASITNPKKCLCRDRQRIDRTDPWGTLSASVGFELRQRRFRPLRHRLKGVTVSLAAGRQGYKRRARGGALPMDKVCLQCQHLPPSKSVRKWSTESSTRLERKSKVQKTGRAFHQPLRRKSTSLQIRRCRPSLARQVRNQSHVHASNAAKTKGFGHQG